MVVLGGKWPFIGGTLELQPMTTRLTDAVERRFVLKLTGVDAAQFVERMELANLSATGTFDGEVPLVFDQNGGRIDNGVLKSRPPGGNVAYVGALTYEDLNPIANFAFDALKSLDYTRNGGRARRLADRRDRHQGALRRGQAGRRDQAEHHHPAARQTAAPASTSTSARRSTS